LKIKKDFDMMLEIQVLAWDRHKNVAWLNPHLLIIGSPTAIHL